MKLEVRVLSVDPRVLGAAEALPADRFHVSSYSEMLELLQASRGGCDIAMLDLALAGFATAKDLRAMEGGEKILVVMFCERDQDRWVCLQSGADAVVTKPLPDTSTLRTAIEAAMLSRESAHQ